MSEIWKLIINGQKCWRTSVYKGLTFFLSLIEPLPRTIILHPVSASSCLAVSPLGPRILPTKLNCGER